MVGVGPQNVVYDVEVRPPEWGLLDDTPAVVVPAPMETVRKNGGVVSNVLRAIARTNSTSLMRYRGILSRVANRCFQGSRAPS